MVEHLQRASTDEEISVPYAENPELTNVLPLKPGADQNIATYVSPAARNCFSCPFSALQVCSPSMFSRSSSCFETRLVLINAVSRVGTWSKISHHADSHTLFKDVPIVSAYGI